LPSWTQVIRRGPKTPRYRFLAQLLPALVSASHRLGFCGNINECALPFFDRHAREGLGNCTAVFPSEDGHLLRKSNFIRRVWTPTRAGVPDAKFHSLRHTCVVLLLMANGNLRVVQQRLGHASIALTMGTYAAESRACKQGSRCRGIRVQAPYARKDAASS
jgi:integrase